MNKYYCEVCDKTHSRSIKQKHRKTESQNRLSLLVVNRFNIKVVKVEDVDCN